MRETSFGFRERQPVASHTHVPLTSTQSFATITIQTLFHLTSVDIHFIYLFRAPSLLPICLSILTMATLGRFAQRFQMPTIITTGRPILPFYFVFPSLLSDCVVVGARRRPCAVPNVFSQHEGVLALARVNFKVGLRLARGYRQPPTELS